MHTLAAVFRTNFEMSFGGSKQVPKETNFVEKKLKISQRQKKFYYQSNKWLKIMFCLMSAVVLFGVKI